MMYHVIRVVEIIHVSVSLFFSTRPKHNWKDLLGAPPSVQQTFLMIRRNRLVRDFCTITASAKTIQCIHLNVYC